MDQLKLYIEKLLATEKVEVSKHQQTLFGDFIKDALIEEKYRLIKETQKQIIETWKERCMVDDINKTQIILPNATVGKQYNYVFELEKTPLKDMSDYEVIIDEKIGVSFDQDKMSITGIPKDAGEHNIFLKYKLPDNTSSFEKEIKLMVNPDPRSLWKELPSDEKDPYWKADFDSAHLPFGTRSMVVASKRGRSHAHEGIFRDDAFDFSYNEKTGWGLIAIADGAGSAKYSRRGSSIACECVIEFFQNLEEAKTKEIESSVSEYIKEPSEANQKILSTHFIEVLGKAAFNAQGKIKEEATKKEAETKDFATTLIFSLFKKYHDQYVIASFWVGDGGIGIYNKTKNDVIVLGVPDSGQFAGQTRFLTMPEIFADGAYAARIKFKIVEDFTALILMTDGITDAKFQTDANLNKIEKWDQLWEDLNGNNTENCQVDFTKPIDTVEKSLLEWLDFWSPGNHDDRTIAILY